MDTNNSGYLSFSNQQEVQDLAQREGRSLLTLDGYVLDATTFAVNHPGGQNTIRAYSGKEISN
jgi:cytochrome b involved in lipid metabolism